MPALLGPDSRRVVLSHVPADGELSGMGLVNPGSACHPRSRSASLYALWRPVPPPSPPRCRPHHPAVHGRRRDTKQPANALRLEQPRWYRMRRCLVCSVLVERGEFCPGCTTDRADHTGQVVVISGRPGVGKSTYVEERRRTGDLVWDLDAVAAALGFPTYPRPLDVAQLLATVFEHVVLHATMGKRDCWLIVSDEAYAGKLASRQGWQLELLTR